MKKPNVEERVMLKQLGLNPKLFLTYDKDWESYTFVQSITGKRLVIRR